ncbi:oligosaccharide biosynthesis protein alg14 like domain-containing protein [Phthorimaea operculella]|nr:oligosaccharide biosynthesis protein alg14 like domain-containing protein [Phthorimaea operculella]
MWVISILVGLFVVLLAALLLRAMYLLYQIFTGNCKLESTENLRTILCIGSGGHTTELLRIVKNFDSNKYVPRLYIVADNDVSSEVKIHTSEQGQNKYALSRIPRSRNVNQSYLSSVFSTLYATLHSIPVVFNFKPDIVLCNGPGTCIPICVVTFILRCLFVLDCRIIFVESICRVRTMSLSGKILQYFADIIVVQWPQLRDACFRAKYFGRLT